MVYSYMLLINCYTLYYMYNHLLCHLLLRRLVVMFYTHSPTSSLIAMLNAQRFLSCSTNDVNLYVHSIYECSTTCAGSINNVLPFKSFALAQSHSFMSLAILTKICINGHANISLLMMSICLNRRH